MFRLFVLLFSWCPIYRTVNVKALTEDNTFTRKELIVTDLGRVRTLHIQIKILRLAWVRFAATGLSGLNLSLHGTLCPSRDAGTRKGPGGQTLLNGHRQNFNYVEIHNLEFRGSVVFFLRQILTNHILSMASAITLDINTSQISSIDSATEGFIITN